MFSICLAERCIQLSIQEASSECCSVIVIYAIPDIIYLCRQLAESRGTQKHHFEADEPLNYTKQSVSLDLIQWYGSSFL